MFSYKGIPLSAPLPRAQMCALQPILRPCSGFSSGCSIKQHVHLFILIFVWQVRIKAAGAVAELCRGNSANREFFSDAAMASLVSLMSSDSQHLQEATIVALAEMAEGSESCKQVTLTPCI
jgi:hypothetical protein